MSPNCTSGGHWVSIVDEPNVQFTANVANYTGSWTKSKFAHLCMLQAEMLKKLELDLRHTGFNNTAKISLTTKATIQYSTIYISIYFDCPYFVQLVTPKSKAKIFYLIKALFES